VGFDRSQKVTSSLFESAKSNPDHPELNNSSSLQYSNNLDDSELSSSKKNRRSNNERKQVASKVDDAIFQVQDMSKKVDNTE